jgi:hypothetical protein
VAQRSPGCRRFEAPPTVDIRRPDAESLAWVEALSGTGRRHDEAVAALHARGAL